MIDAYPPQIKALLLCAGYGKRLRPITLNTPKCLVKIAHRTLLQTWLDKLAHLNCKSVLINTHYRAADIVEYVQSITSGYCFPIDTVFEPDLLGTCASLIANRSYFENSTILMIHSDNITTDDLTSFIAAHHERAPHILLSMLTFNTDNPQSCGIVQCDSNMVVTQFVEKPQYPTGNLANCAVYLFDCSLIDFIYENCPHATDFSTEVLPLLMGRILSHQTNSPFIDVGTLESLAKAKTIFTPYLISNGIDRN